MDNELNAELWKTTPFLVLRIILEQLFFIQKKIFMKKANSIEFLKEIVHNNQNDFFLEKFLFDHFFFLQFVEGNFMNFSANPTVEFDKGYSYLSFNTNIIYLKNLMEKLVLPNDLKNSIIAGGYFSKYSLNPVSKQFSEIYRLINQEKDIDLYILTNDIKIYELIYRKKLIIYKNRSNSYQFSSFKIKTEGNLSVNFIFPNIKIGVTVKKLIDSFDFDFSKIFYSYKKHSIFVHVHLLEGCKKIQSEFDLKSNTKDLNVYRYRLEFLYKCFSVMIPELQEYHYEFLPKNFWRYDLTRFIKYVFKGYYSEAEEENLIKIISYFEKPLARFLKIYYEKNV